VYLTEAYPVLFGLDDGLEIKLLLRVSSSINSEYCMNPFLITYILQYDWRSTWILSFYQLAHIFLFLKRFTGNYLKDLIVFKLPRKGYLLKLHSPSKGNRRLRMTAKSREFLWKIITMKFFKT
jgi:hypothetical protein